jgi:hypothetical protein
MSMAVVLIGGIVGAAIRLPVDFLCQKSSRTSSMGNSEKERTVAWKPFVIKGFQY